MPERPASAGSHAGERLATHEPRLRLLLLHLAGPALRRRVDLDDLLQEVYLRALTSELPAPTHGEAELARFLVALARHAVIDVARALRAEKRGPPPLSLDRGDEPGERGALRASAVLARSGGPATKAAAGETERALHARFEELPAEYRRVIGLRQLEGLSAREAAARLGRSETAVHSLYRRALLAWEQALERGPRAPGRAEDARSRGESGAGIR